MVEFFAEQFPDGYLIISFEPWGMVMELQSYYKIDQKLYRKKMKEYGGKKDGCLYYFSTKEEAEAAIEWLESMLLMKRLLGEDDEKRN